jgi:hypothetical protein
VRIDVVRAAVAAVIIALAAMTPLMDQFGASSSDRASRVADRFAPRRTDAAVLADDNDDDNDDDENDEDNDDEDNDDDNDDDDNDEDNDDEDNEDDNDDEDNDDDNDDDEDNDEGDDNDDADADMALDNVEPPSGAVGTSSPRVTPPQSFDPSVTQATGVSTGGDSSVGLPGDRVVLRIFPWMPQGVSFTVRLIDPATVPAPPGTRVGSLTFQVEARDAGGSTLTALPAEVNLSARYTDQEVFGLNESQVTLMWLDPATNQWQLAPKLTVDPSTNYVAASVTTLGAYAVCVP